jgi:hypothetical protein
MLALADIANDDGEAYPSTRLLVERTGLSERAIQGALSRLEQAGHLSRDMRSGRSTIYHLLPSKPPQHVHPAADAPRSTCTPRGAARAPTPAADAPTPAARAPITITQPSPTRQKENTRPCPAGVSDSVWADWLAHRKAKRAAVTQTVVDAIAREAARAGMSLDAALTECCARGWTGFKAEWVQQGSRSSPAAARDAETAEFLGRLTGGLAGTKPNREVVDVEPANVRRIA